MILLDYMMLVLLSVTIFYCWKLNNKINEIKQGRKSLQNLISNFDISIEKAEGYIKELKSIGSKHINEINEKMEEAKILKSDLIFINDRASNIADKLDKIISSARNIENYRPSNETSSVYSTLEQKYITDIDSSITKRSTIESLLAKIASVKNGKNNESELVNPKTRVKHFENI